MLHQFTWQQFLIAALILTLIWYLAIILLYYRHSVASFLSGDGKPEQPERIRKEWEEELEDEEVENMMGKPAEPEGASSLPMDSIRFAAKSSEKDEELGLIPDVLEELKTIFNILEKENGDKTDFFSLLQLVKGKYPDIGSNSNIEQINEHILDHLPFQLNQEELENLWD
ncbi:hypothetical protein [Pedobacter glucosidilyticus]|uniref:hypothetical protein n=1 Tax=Pedobacter glucosidilyticus TaxID=1122941 RepID=UPI0026ECE6E3|nr:hypothetical protein [Pedobacter glucosidilyticus]